MIEHYIAGVARALNAVLDLLTLWAMPLAVGLGLLVVAGALSFAFARHQGETTPIDWRRRVGNLLGYGAVGILLVAGWASLRTTRPLAQMDIRWREAADATSNPVPDAPPVYQPGPAVAALIERTYSRTLTLPPSFLNRLGAEGVGVLAPYLTDPSTQNVVRLRDTFRRSGRNAVFTRESTVLEEAPIPFSDSRIKVSFERLAGRAYDAKFEGRYFFQNSSKKPTLVHFLFSLPDAGTVRDLKIVVGNETLTEPTDSNPNRQLLDENEDFATAPTDSNTYEWKKQMAPGEKREAIVTYNLIGARIWSYDLGSRRRRVQQFQLDADPGGEVRFVRGSLQPTKQESRNLSWQLSNVVTAQKLALVFPPDNLANQLYLQALSALPASFILFFVGIVLLSLWFHRALDAARLGGAVLLFGFGLGASTVAAIYLGPVAGLIVAPLAGAILASRLLGRDSLLVAIPLALLPATFLSAQNSGLLVLLLSAMALTALVISARREAAK